MTNFFKDSIRELKHVVWPTKEETRKYFIAVISILVIFWLYVTAASTVFTNVIFYIKDLVK